MYEKPIEETLKFLSTRPEVLDYVLYIRVERVKNKLKEGPPDKETLQEISDLAAAYRKRWTIS
jgi:hypothetical protein